jgi:hypothetical protein
VFGGPEITGVGLESAGPLLQAVNDARKQQNKMNCQIPIAGRGFDLVLSWQAAIGNRQSLLLVIVDPGGFGLFPGERFTRNAILTFNPAAEIDELAALRTEGTKRVFFPLDRLTTGWTVHELEPRTRLASLTKEMLVA